MYAINARPVYRIGISVTHIRIECDAHPVAGVGFLQLPHDLFIQGTAVGGIKIDDQIKADRIPFEVEAVHLQNVRMGHHPAADILMQRHGRIVGGIHRVDADTRENDLMLGIDPVGDLPLEQVEKYED